MGIAEHVDRFQRQHPVLGFPLAVVYKFFDDQAGYLVALIAYYAFLSFFPLLLLFTTLLGAVLQSRPDLQERLLESTLAEIPVLGAQLGDPGTLQGSTIGIVASGVVALYGGLGIGQAFQYAMNTAWGVPRNSRPNPFKARARSFVLLLNVLLFVAATTGLSVVATTGLISYPATTRVLLTIAQYAVTALVFALAMRRAVARDVGLKDVALGALGAAATWQMVQYFGVGLVERATESSSSNGIFAIVIGLFAFFHLAAMGIVLSAEADVVRHARLWPRALLTPFTDNVDLTDGDRRAYTQQARIGRFKGYQQIDVGFDTRPESAEGDVTRSGPQT
ncbi:YihY/virulence factor BrkB family protein [Knoellia aerolata]|uniref:Ribonuclease BN n=1 Tax=Knoellia aerolata DSM 18566 TaxID=1385519 RepID=A0A0A0K2Q4_9MICO|nr:YhjD/YihY/BrkB family envelope integrity protein [Knoellia aerolata]KGN42011.1 ribonuclease BN [Knoellia aerolata DSM 18566]